MKRITISLLTTLVALLAAPHLHAAGGGAVLSYSVDLTNEPSLQRGARNFMNYCSGCHGLKYLRYSSIARDLGIPEAVVEENLIFGDATLNDHVDSAMPATSADWFGQQPPDLSLTARSRGADWVYSFLNTFYVDEGKSTGYNNLQLAGAAMPHVLAELQGVVVKREEEGHGDGGHGGGHGDDHGLELVEEGDLTPAEYKDFTADLTNFLAYAAEPGKADRIALGWKVMFYLLLLFGVAYLMKREYWKDVH